MAKLSVRNTIRVALTLLLILAVDSGIAPAGAHADVREASAQWTVRVGADANFPPTPGGPTGTWQSMQYFPMTLTVGAGDTVKWQIDSAEPHTVSFTKTGDPMPALIIPEGGSSTRLMLNPEVVFPQGGNVYSSFMPGIDSPQPGPRTYALTFDKPGTYNYLCVIHGSIGMVGSVTVVLPQLYLPLITEPP